MSLDVAASTSVPTSPNVQLKRPAESEGDSHRNKPCSLARQVESQVLGLKAETGPPLWHIAKT